MSKSIFKPYVQNQAYLIPPTWDELIDKNHPVRVVNDVINRLDLRRLRRTYSSLGQSSYDPAMLLKAIIYSYINNIYSSRRIEENIKSNIHLIWLCGCNQPDHNTINRFRSSKLEKYLKDIFKQIVLMLADEGLLSLKSLYVDGTKIEANANKYSFVWGKSIKSNKQKILQNVETLWHEVQKLAKDELRDTEPTHYKQVDPSTISETVAAIQEIIEDKEAPDEIKKKLKYIAKNYPDKLKEYAEKEEILKGRNSYSKTDPDATFMRMKEDHMMNGQLKAGYNVQISTNNRIIINYDIYQTPGDTLTFTSHIGNLIDLYKSKPECITADSGYGSDENYEYLTKQGIESYIKYNYFHQEQKGIRQKKYPFASDFLFYNEEDDFYVCPSGQKMKNIGSAEEENESGFKQPITRYEAGNCTNCPMRSRCHKKQGNRVIEVNHRLRQHKKKARENLTSQEGQFHRKKRPQDVESVFANIKQNKGFKRFTLRGLNKVETEFGLIAIAQNLQRKITS